jgi:hypothetical protein
VSLAKLVEEWAVGNQDLPAVAVHVPCNTGSGRVKMRHEQSSRPARPRVSRSLHMQQDVDRRPRWMKHNQLKTSCMLPYSCKTES